MAAEIFSVGSELLLGQTIDTNAAFLAERLSQLGIDCFHKTTVGDNLERLAAALKASLERSDIIITTGGLGPTEDDVTAAGVARALGVDLSLDEASAEAVKQRLAERGLPQLPSHLKQAQIPQGGRALPNPVGTAPGFIIEKGDKRIICLPGPPAEMKPMFEESAASYLRSLPGAGGTIKSRLLRFMGIGESLIEEKIRDLIQSQKNPTLAPLASQGEVKLRITAKASGEAEAEGLISPVEAEIRKRLGRFIVGVDEKQIEEVVGQMLRERELTLAVAESCTGGLISHRITNISGSSDYFRAGLVCYSNSSKIALLGVKEDTLLANGAVSRQVALEMAQGVRRMLQAHVGLSSTGVAGPAGETRDKPVGLVYIAISIGSQTACEEHRFKGARELIKQQTANAALDLLRKGLEGNLSS
jgi:nicotinamide-nucleotide amidase